jgi:hypothetical protein
MLLFDYPSHHLKGAAHNYGSQEPPSIRFTPSNSLKHAIFKCPFSGVATKANDMGVFMAWSMEE